jgi:uncharacterized membrane protein
MLAINIPENKICLGSAAHAGPKRYVAQGIGVSRCISARVGFASQPLLQTEVEVRRTAKKKLRVLGSAAGLGVVAGLRSMTAPATLAWAANRGLLGQRGPATLLRPRRALTIATAMAVGEMIMDKTSIAPDRTIAPSLAWRIASGAVVGGSLAAAKRKPAAWGALAGGLGALAGSYAGFHLRRKLSQKVPPTAAAIAEDAIAIGSGLLLAKVA